MRNWTICCVMGLWVVSVLWGTACTESPSPTEPGKEPVASEQILKDATDGKVVEPSPEPKPELPPEPRSEPRLEPSDASEPVPELPKEVVAEKIPDRTYPPGTAPACPAIQPKAVPASLKLSSFYKKYVNSGGIPIVASDKVPAAAFQQAHYIIANMLRNKPCIRQAIALSGIRVGIIGDKEVTTDMPEYSDLNTAFPGTDWNKRARGLGATLVRPLVTGSEENLLKYANNRWKGEHVFLHEFAHSLFEFGIYSLKDGVTQQQALVKLYNQAKQKGLWKNTYAMTNEKEYWAETVQSWFNDNVEVDPPNGVHNNINTRQELQSYDPDMAKFLAGFFDKTPWPVTCNKDGKGPVWKDPTPKDPMSAKCEFRRVFLKDLGCTKAGQQKSGSSQTRGTVVLVNRGFKETVRIFWVDSNGKKKDFGSIPPRRQRSFGSFQGHVWRLEKSDGTCLGIYNLTHPSNVVAVE